MIKVAATVNRAEFDKWLMSACQKKVINETLNCVVFMLLYPPQTQLLHKLQNNAYFGLVYATCRQGAAMLMPGP